MKIITQSRQFLSKWAGKTTAAVVAGSAVITSAGFALAASPNAAAYTAMVGTVSDETTGMSGFVVNVSPYLIGLVAVAILGKLAIAWLAMGGKKAA